MRPISGNKVVSSDLKDFVDKLNKNQSGTAQLHAKNENGKIIFYRASNKSMTAGSLSEHLSFMPERQAARNEIKRMLKQSGIEITHEIKKAMPSIKHQGDANSLLALLLDNKEIKIALHDKIKGDGKAALQAAQNKLPIPTNQTELLSSFEYELEKTDISPSQASTFIRHDCNATKGMAAIFKKDFVQTSKDIAQNVKNSISHSFNSGSSSDEALTSGYKTLLDNLKSLKFSDEFCNFSKQMSKKIDDLADKKIEENPANAKAIRATANLYKEKLLAVFTLRTFLPALNAELLVINSDVEKSVTKNNNSIDEDLKPSKFADIITKLINNADMSAKIGPSKLASSNPIFVKFILDKSENNLSNFSALQNLQKEIIDL
jgi:hypothetical protein